METIIYLIRHSESVKLNNILNNDSLQLKNEKIPLSVNGEKIIEKISENKELLSIDLVYSSNYVRSISTAKYIALKNNLILNIDERFNERKHGVNDYNELPVDFEKRQFEDEYFKVANGECLKEVKERMSDALNEVLRNNIGKKIVIVSHSTAIASLLSYWCDVKYDGNYLFNNRMIFDGKWHYCETFKLRFNNNELMSIENIKFLS